MSKRFFAFFLSFLLSVLTVFTVSADSGDVIAADPLFRSGDVGFYNYDDVSSFFNDIPSSLFIQSFYNSTGIDIDDYYYYINVGDYEPRYDRFPCQIALFPKVNGLVDNTLDILSSNGSTYVNTNYVLSSVYSCECSFFLNDTLSLHVNNSSLSFRSDYSSKNVKGLITNIPIITVNGDVVTSSFVPQISGQFDFKDGYIDLFVRALTSAEFDNRVYLEIYDALPAIEQLIYKPAKYVYPVYSGHSPVITGHKVDDYLRPLETGITYTVTVDTLVKAGCLDNNPYVARAYCFDDKGKPYEICNIEFALDGDSFYNFIDTDGDGAPDVRKDSDGTLTDIATGKVIDPDELSYNFGYGVTEPSNNVYDGIPDYDFTFDVSDDIVGGAGLVRTLFDRIIAKSGLSGFLITVLAISIASWFIFGRRA